MAQLLDWFSHIGKVYFTQAQVVANPVSYDETSVLSNLYLLFLHNVCRVFGNVYDACLIAHFVTYILTAIVWFFVIKMLVKKVAPSVLVTLLVFVPAGFVLAVTLNPFVLGFLFIGFVLLLILGCMKALIKASAPQVEVSEPQTVENIENPEPVVTVVDFDAEKAVVVPVEEEKEAVALEEEKPAIFIPKSMKIPKRVSKPKLDYSEAVAVDNFYYDVDPPIQDDFDFKI